MFRHYFFCLLSLLIVLFSCSSKKKLLDSGVRPSNNMAEKYAGILNVKEADISNGRLYRFIDDWYGTRYRIGGIDKTGIDCSGFTFMLQKEVYGKALPRTTGQQVLAIKRKYEDQLQEGDLVFFDYDGRRFSHVGVYLQNGYFVHASERKGIIITNLQDPWTYKYFSRGGSVEN